MARSDEIGPYWQKLLEQALRCEITAAEFWQMTPNETWQTIEAYGWRLNQQRREAISMAWLTAALTRAKRLPKLAQLLAEKAKPLRGAELHRRRREFAEMTAGLDVTRLNKSQVSDE